MGNQCEGKLRQVAGPMPIGRVHRVADAAHARVDILHIERVKPLFEHDVVPLLQSRSARREIDSLFLLSGGRDRAFQAIADHVCRGAWLPRESNASVTGYGGQVLWWARRFFRSITSGRFRVQHIPAPVAATSRIRDAQLEPNVLYLRSRWHEMQPVAGSIRRFKLGAISDRLPCSSKICQR